MKLFTSLWVLTDNDAMDVTQIESSEPPTDESSEAASFNQHTIQPKHDYSNIIYLLDYIKLKKLAYSDG